MTAHARQRRRRGFSLVELLIALVISSTLLTAALVSLDAMFKGYQQTTDSASSHVIARIAVNRILGMVRTGSDFGPFPVDVLDADANPLAADYFEFVSERDASGAIATITRIEYRYPGVGALQRSWSAAADPPELGFEPTGPGELFVVFVDAESGTEQEFQLLSDVRNAVFTLEYDIGPKLARATVDVTVESAPDQALEVESGAVPRTMRMVASSMPRRSVIE